jgi:hypothetical protein
MMLSRLKLPLSASILGVKDAVALNVEVLEADAHEEEQEGKRTGTKSATQRRLGLTPHQQAMVPVILQLHRTQRMAKSQSRNSS